MTYRGWRGREFRWGLSIGVVAALAWLCTGPAAAQDSCPGRQKRGDGADIQCHVDKVLEKHGAVIETIKGKLRECVGRNCGVMQAHLDKVEADNNRARGQHRRMKASDYDGLNRTRKGRCKGTQPGNTDANCYQDPTLLEDSGEVETEFGGDLVDQLEEMEEGLDRTNTLLSETPAPTPAGLAAPAARVASTLGGVDFRTLYDYKQDPDYPAWLHVADNPKALIPTVFALNIAAAVAKGAEKVARDFCQQDFVGFNASPACIPLSVLVSALDGTTALLNFNMSDATAWDTHGAYLRAEDLNANLGLVDGRVTQVSDSASDAQAAVGALEAKIAVLEDQVVTLSERILTFQNQIIQLLLTQSGRRSVAASILTCDGTPANPCPQVVVDCSPTTGLCTFK